MLSPPPPTPKLDHFRRRKLKLTPVLTNSPLFPNSLSSLSVDLRRAPGLAILGVIEGALVEGDPIIPKQSVKNL